MKTSLATPPERDSFLAALNAIPDAPINSGRPSALYSASLFVVAVVMVLLPAIYLSLVGGVIYGIVYHAIHDVTIFEQTSSIKVMLLAYFGPIVIGAILVFFMFKPLLARAPKQAPAVQLEEADHPLLWAYVDKICGVVDAPRPRVIEVDAAVNASASLRRGWLSLFGKDLRLVIGLPFLQGMDVTMLGGIIAHEFGHFSQGAGMRLTFIIRSINGWFSRVVFGRDAWDAQLAEGSRSGMGITILIFGLARLLVWLTRQVLRGLMYVGHAVSCFALRQMEYDADSCAARFAGSAAISPTMLQVGYLSYGQQSAMQILRENWQSGRLPRNVATLFVGCTQRFSEETRKQIQSHTAAGKAGIFSTHPSDSQRVSAAERLALPGVIRSDAPASILLESFEDVAAAVTRSYYRNMGIEVREEQLVDPEMMMGADDERNRDLAVEQAVWEESMDYRRPVVPMEVEQWSASTYATEREYLRQLVKDCQASVKRWEKAQEERILALNASALIRAGFTIDENAFKLDDRDLAAATRKLEQMVERLRQVSLEFRTIENHSARLLGLAMLCPVANQWQRARDDAGEYLRAFAQSSETCRELVDGCLQMRVLLQNAKPDDNSPAFVAAVRNTSAELGKIRTTLAKQFAAVPYPFEASEPAKTASVALIGNESIPPDDLVAHLQFSEFCLQQLVRCYFRCLGFLCRVADEVVGSGAEDVR